MTGRRDGRFPWWFTVVVALTASGLGYWMGVQTVPAETPGLLLRDYEPELGIRVPVTTPEKARFPVIDVHQHLSAQNDPAVELATMDSLGVLTVINVGRGLLLGDALSEFEGRFNQQSRGRMPSFCHVDFSRVNEADFEEVALSQLEDSVRRGAIGLKIFKDLGLRYRDSQGKLYRADDPKFDPLWRKAGELGIPVAIHTGDPVPFFKPVDRFNERYLSLAIEGTSRAQAWAWHGKTDGYRHEDYNRMLENIIRKHPETTFIMIHCGMMYEHLEDLDRVLNAYPNAYFDIAASAKHLGRQPHFARKMLIKHADRALFGLDIETKADPRIYRYFFRVLETDDDYFEHPEEHLALPWKVYGLNLPDDVLRKLYFENALKVIPGLRDQLDVSGLLPVSTSPGS